MSGNRFASEWVNRILLHWVARPMVARIIRPKRISRLRKMILAMPFQNEKLNNFA
ncbi:hypothetical protein JCM19296_2365 [Nonlabens ulvanivorans]|uniref:Uncharacterized protein n=1 Tax=Nonlabens ulvanivorans TaxID=906888 RepID=A0A081DCW9_NONUL|nr:hypothetical protein JCM19296_2365 [Nonlabens ulvanivorans]